MNDSNYTSVKNDYVTFVKQSGVGEFNVSAIQFFSRLTKVINSMNDIIIHEKETLISRIKDSQAKAKSNLTLIMTSSLIVLFVVVVTLTQGFCNYTINKIVKVVDSISDQLNNLRDLSSKVVTVSTGLSESGLQQASVYKRRSHRLMRLVQW